METSTNPLEAFTFRQNYMNIDRKVDATGDTTVTLTGGTKENRINAILTNIFSPKGFRLARPILEKSEGLAKAARVVIVRYDRNTPKIGGGMTVTVFDAAGREMWGEYLTVGPRGGVFYAGNQ
jgi:hypothetical protein